MSVYVESSGAMKLLVAQAETSALEEFFDAVDASDEKIVAIALLETELRRAAVRLTLAQEEVSTVLDRFDLVDVDRAMPGVAGLLPGQRLRSLRCAPRRRRPAHGGHDLRHLRRPPA